MAVILTLALKDIKLLTRDWFGLFWIFVFPLVYALFFGAIFSGEGSKNRAIKLAVVDLAKTASSQAFIDKLKKSEALDVELLPIEEAERQVMKGKKTAYLVLKSGFDGNTNFFGGKPRAMELGTFPTRRAELEMVKGLLMEAAFADMKDLFTDPKVARDQARQAMKDIDKAPDIGEADRQVFRLFFGALDLFLDQMPKAGKGKDGPSFEMVDLKVKDLSGADDLPRSAFEITFPSSILWAIMGSLTSFAVSLVLERTQGTMLRLRTAPMSLGQLLAGKGLGCFLTCCFVTCVLLAFATVALGVRLGNIAYLALAIVSIAFCFTGLMMFISTLGNTEQGVAGAGWGLMMPMAMLGGGMVPLFVMPSWMLTASHASPVKWGILALEGAIWRRFTFLDMIGPCAILLAVGAVGYSLGVWTLRRREG